MIEKMLREAGFKGGISTDKEVLDKFSTDESIFSIRPQIVIQPKNGKDVEIATELIAEQTKKFSSLSLTPRGAGTGVSGGSLTDSIVVDTKTYMDSIKVFEKKGEVYFTCGPGAIWGQVEKKLKKHNTYCPTAPASKDFSTIGGGIGNNAAGSDTLRYGHSANWIESLEVVLRDGKTYTIEPITYRDYQSLTKKNNAYAEVLKGTFEMIEKNEKKILQARPKVTKNTAGYQIWDILDGSVASFKRGKAKMDLTRLIAGSQGSVGIITSITMRTLPISTGSELITIPVFDLPDAGKIIVKALEYDPVNVELFDGLTFEMALKHPDFFKKRIEGINYYKSVLSLYTTYHLTFRRKLPEFVLLVTLDKKSMQKRSAKQIVEALRRGPAKKARLVKNAAEVEMMWQLRRGGYPLSKYEDPKKRPAAYLEDMIVPPKNLSKFFADVKRLLKKYNVIAAVHGHGGNGHLHFYPLLDFENKTTPKLIEKMTEEFFATAMKYDGSFCGEHNDGIIRTPHLSKMFSKEIITLFENIESLFDPDDIFNPGKKVHPRFSVMENIRTTN